jgi:hypothetical protein
MDYLPWTMHSSKHRVLRIKLSVITALCVNTLYPIIVVGIVISLPTGRYGVLSLQVPVIFIFSTRDGLRV